MASASPAVLGGKRVVSGGNDIRFGRKGSRVARLIGKMVKTPTPTGHLGLLVHHPFSTFSHLHGAVGIASRGHFADVNGCSSAGTSIWHVWVISCGQTGVR